MDLTQRLARAIGPSLTGALVAIMPLTQFFTIEAISFFVSALTLVFLGSQLTWQKHAVSAVPYDSIKDLFREVADGFSYAAKDEALTYCLISLTLQAALWGIAFTVGLPLLVKQSFGDNVANYGYLVAAYGVGSVVGNVLCANLHVRSSWVNVFLSDALCGAGFCLIALCNSMQTAAAGSIIAAIGGAAGDLLLLNLIMKEVPSSLLGKTMSLRMMTLAGGYSLGLIAASALFRLGSASTVIAWCGGLMVVSCVYGAIRYANYKKPDEAAPSVIMESEDL